MGRPDPAVTSHSLPIEAKRGSTMLLHSDRRLGIHSFLLGRSHEAGRDAGREGLASPAAVNASACGCRPSAEALGADPETGGQPRLFPYRVNPITGEAAAGDRRLVLADDRDIALQSARRPLGEVAIEGPLGDRGRTLEVKADSHGPVDVVVDLGAAREDRRATMRVFDLAERDGDKALVGGTTFVTVAA